MVSRHGSPTNSQAYEGWCTRTAFVCRGLRKVGGNYHLWVLDVIVASVQSTLVQQLSYATELVVCCSVGTPGAEECMSCRSSTSLAVRRWALRASVICVRVRIDNLRSGWRRLGLMSSATKCDRSSSSGFKLENIGFPSELSICSPMVCRVSGVAELCRSV